MSTNNNYSAVSNLSDNNTSSVLDYTSDTSSRNKRNKNKNRNKRKSSHKLSPIEAKMLQKQCKKKHIKY